MNGPHATLRPLSTGRATLAVAEREIVALLRSKAFLISLALTVVMIIGSILLFTFMGSRESQAPSLAVVQGTEVPSTVPTGDGQSGAVHVVPVPDEAAGEQLLRADEVGAVLSSDPTNPLGLKLTALDSPPMTLLQSMSVTPTVQLLDSGQLEGMLRFMAPLIFGLAFMMLCMSSGSMIVQSTVQEKQSRIVEILLATIPARALLAGKILGNSAAALGQALVFALAGLAGMALTGHLELLGLFGAPMLWFLAFFVPGFVLVASMFAGSAALVSRQEDAGTVMTPTMMLVMAPYFLVIFAQDNPTVMTVASYIPFSAPVAMPVRLAFDEAQWWEAIISLGILVATTVLVMLVAARVYRGALLHMGQRMKLGAALQAGKR